MDRVPSLLYALTIGLRPVYGTQRVRPVEGEIQNIATGCVVRMSNNDVPPIVGLLDLSAAVVVGEEIPVKSQVAPLSRL